MICVRKPAAPAVLTKEGVAASDKHCADHDIDSTAYANGASKFTFDSGIYGHESVKFALRRAQHDKCAFCDSDMMHTGYGDVEHFRPKGAWQQREGALLRYPGYFWLVYAWDNLFLSCTLCNQRYKRNLFPLRVQKLRACPSKRDVSNEAPLVIAPSENPEKHITFVGETAVPVKNSRRGIATIAILDLNRDELAKRRRTLRAYLLALLKSRNLLAARAETKEEQDHLDSLNQLLAQAITDTAEYAAMARAMLT